MLNHFNTQNSILYCSKRKRSGSSKDEMSNKTSRMAKEPPDLPPDDGTTEKAEDTSRDVELPSDVVDSVGGLVEEETPARRDEMMSDVKDGTDNVGQQGGRGVWASTFAANAAASTRRTTRSTSVVGYVRSARCMETMPGVEDGMEDVMDNVGQQGG